MSDFQDRNNMAEALSESGGEKSYVSCNDI